MDLINILKSLFPRQITNIISGIKPKLYGNGRNIRDWIHVYDHVTGIWEIWCMVRLVRPYLWVQMVTR